MIRHVTHGPLWVKVLPIVLVVLFGLTERSAAYILVPLVVWRITVLIRGGIREQYWEPFWHQCYRHWEDLVWGATRWLNVHSDRRHESPQEGIERLAGPWKKMENVKLQSASRATALIPKKKKERLVGAMWVLQDRNPTRYTPELLPQPLSGLNQAPHELAVH